MSNLCNVRRWVGAAAAAVLLLAVVVSAAPAQQKLPLKPDTPGTGVNHRLILKDGSYQLVRKYEVVGDRVRYISVERGGEWEELPESLVDWEATRKWERDHTETAAATEGKSPAMAEAADIDKEEAAARAEQAARMPEVAKGLELPDEDSVFALDTFHGTPELVELPPNELGVDAKTHHGLSTLNPLAGARASIELPGAHAKVHLHVNDPSIYLALDGTGRCGGGGFACHDGEYQRRQGSGQPQAWRAFAAVGVCHCARGRARAVRIVGAIHISPTGNITQNEDEVPVKVEVLPGKHWLKLTPQHPLLIGEYALVEIISPSDINQTVWDFQVNPQLGDNEGSIGPILKQPAP